ncbi:MAG: ABC transporter permease [Promethearchaeota archaeon]
MSLITWFLSDLSGDPLAAYVGETARLDLAEMEAARERLGLNKPWYFRFFIHISRYLEGDWGYSPSNRDAPVFEMIRDKFPATVDLAIMALLIAISIGIPLGIFQAVRRNQRFDNLTRPIILSVYSVPLFILALIMRLTIIKGALFLRQYLNERDIAFIFPMSGRFNPHLSAPPQKLLFGLLPPTDLFLVDAILGMDPNFFLDCLLHLFYPALTLGLSLTAIIARMTRMAMIEVMHADYILLARAKGLRERVIVYRHALKNALFPILTVGGVILAHLLTGSIFVELIFRWPGIGAMIARGGLVLDMPLIQGYCIIASIIYVTTNLIVDLLYGWLDPRIRESL